MTFVSEMATNYFTTNLLCKLCGNVEVFECCPRPSGSVDSNERPCDKAFVADRLECKGLGGGCGGFLRDLVEVCQLTTTSDPGTEPSSEAILLKSNVVEKCVP
jgi:hypothetical protein